MSLRRRFLLLLVGWFHLVSTATSSPSSSGNNYDYSAGWAIECDGVDDWGTLPIPNLPAGSWTFEAWVHFPADRPIRTGTAFQIVSEASDQELIKVPISHNVDRSHGAVYALNLPIVYNDGENVESAVEPGRSYHVAVAVEKPMPQNNHTISAHAYWNGRLITSFAAPGPSIDTETEEPQVMGSATIHLCFLQKVGTFSNLRERFGAMQVDDVRFWNTAKSQTEIESTMFSLNATEHQETLMHWWKFDEGDGVIVKDSMSQASHGSLAQRRDFTNQRPSWVPSLVPNRHQANFTPVVGNTNQLLRLRHPHWEGEWVNLLPTQPAVYQAPDTPTRVQIPYSVANNNTATATTGTYDIVVQNYRPPIAGNNKCLILNGFDAYALGTNFQLPTSFSLDVWVQPFSLPPAGWTDFGSKHTVDGGNIFLWEVNLVRNDEGRLVPTLFCRLSKARFFGGELLYQPQHLAMTFEADLTTNTTNATLYRNGQVIYEARMEDILTNEDQQGLPWSMGQDFDNRGVVVPSDYWHGTLDEYRFWSRALTPEEVQHSMVTAIDHGPDYPHLFKTFSYDDATKDDEYSLHGRAKLGPCESGFQARPYLVTVEEGHNMTFVLPAYNPEPEEDGDSSLKFELVKQPSKGTISLDQDAVTYVAEGGGDSIETLSYRVTNRYGQEAKHLGLVDIHLLRHAPTVAGLRAVEGRGYESGSEVLIEFSEPTNTPDVGSGAGIVIEFSPPVAKNLLFSWVSDTVLKALIADPLDFSQEKGNTTIKSAEDLIGTCVVKVQGMVKAKDELSVETNTTSPTLQGSWVSDLFLKCQNGQPDTNSGRCLCTSS